MQDTQKENSESQSLLKDESQTLSLEKNYSQSMIKPSKEQITATSLLSNTEFSKNLQSFLRILLSAKCLCVLVYEGVI